LGGDALIYYADTDGTAVGVGPAISYYFGSGNQKLHPFLAASTSLTHSGSTDDIDLTFRGSAGLLRMLSRSLGLDGRVYYQTGWGPTVLGLGFGLSAFLL
jgi:hypothetical protein